MPRCRSRAAWCRSRTEAIRAVRFAIPPRSATSSASGPRPGAFEQQRIVVTSRCRGRWPLGRRRRPLPECDCRSRRQSPLSINEDGARFRAPLDRSFKGVRVAWWRGLGGIPFEPVNSTPRRREPPGVRDLRLRRRGSGARRLPGSTGIQGVAICRQLRAMRLSSASVPSG